MRPLSKTGLIPSLTRKVYIKKNSAKIDLTPEAQPASFSLKPLAGLYKPYRYGCSILCNHPADEEINDLFIKNKREFINKEGKGAAYDGLTIILDETENENSEADLVPEELFRRYTETDSRPTTPHINPSQRTSGLSRRCLTPDPSKEKTTIVVDLRRSHSQELLHSSLEPPVIIIQQFGSRRGSEELTKNKVSPYTVPVPLTVKALKKEDKGKESNSQKEIEEDQEDDGTFIKRRGKRRRKKSSAKNLTLFQPSLDPETQVGTIGPDSHNPSARHSVTSEVQNDELENNLSGVGSERKKSSLGVHFSSYIDFNILKILRRELTAEIYDNEFNFKRRKALEEALKTLTNEKNSNLESIENELGVSNLNTDLWLNLPRTFSRSNARFELPADSRMLSIMIPLDYLKECVWIKDRRKILYNAIFVKFKFQISQLERVVYGKHIQKSLNILMGKELSLEDSTYFRNLIEWKDEEEYDFKTFCCICATCERILAKNYTRKFLDRSADPCDKLEEADFESLNRKLHGKNANEKLIKLLYSIKNF